MHKKEREFIYKGKDEHDCNVYVAYLQLPDDGVVDSEQFLEIKVRTHEEEKPEIQLAVLYNNRKKRYELLSVEVGNMAALSMLLYGTARMITKQFMVPV